MTIIRNTNKPLFNTKDFFEACKQARKNSKNGGVWFVIRDANKGYFVIEKEHYDKRFYISHLGITQKIKDHAYLCYFADVLIEISTTNVVLEPNTGETRIKYRKKKTIKLTNEKKAQLLDFRNLLVAKKVRLEKLETIVEKIDSTICNTKSKEFLDKLLTQFDNDYLWITKKILTSTDENEKITYSKKAA